MINNDQFKKNVAAIKKNGAKLQEVIQESLDFCVYNSIKDGQITPANQLISVLPKVVRKNDIIDYLGQFGNFGFDHKTKTMTYKKKHEHGEDNALNIVAEMPEFADWAKDKAPTLDADVWMGVVSLINRTLKKKEKGGKIEHEEALTQLKNTLPEAYQAKVHSFA